MAKGKPSEYRKKLNLDDCVPVTLSGNCMAPTLMRDDVVIAHRSRPPRVGEVALIDYGGMLAIHRIVGRIAAGRQCWYVHMGDASNYCGLAGPKDVLGLVKIDAQRRAPALYAHALTLALMLGGVICAVGAYPGKDLSRTLGLWLKKLLRAVA